MYHRVAERPADDPDLWSLCVSPRRFEQQLEVLRRHAELLPLDRLMASIPSFDRRRPPVAITFDDGYADNLLFAKPILERYDVPATVFVASGYTGSRRLFWSDRLAWTIFGAVTLPRELRLASVGHAFEWRAADVALPPEASAGRAAASCTKGGRRELVLRLWSFMRPLPAGEQDRMLDDLQQWACYAPLPRPCDLPMSEEEVCRLATDSPVEVGAHSVSHCDLPALSAEDQMAEIAGSKAALEHVLGRRVSGFAYPYGLFNDASVRCVREAGFDRAFSTRSDVCLRGIDPYRLPRFGIGDWDSEVFDRQLQRRFDP